MVTLMSTHPYVMIERHGGILPGSSLAPRHLEPAAKSVGKLVDLLKQQNMTPIGLGESFGL